MGSRGPNAEKGEGSRHVVLNLTEEEAQNLYSYTRTSLDGDDSFDRYRETLVGVCDKLEGQLYD